MDLATAGYFISSGLFTILAILLMTQWRGRLQGMLLLIVVISVVVWAFASGFNGYPEDDLYQSSVFFEILRNLALYTFLFGLLKPLYVSNQKEHFFKILYIVVYASSLFLLVGSMTYISTNQKLMLSGSLGMSIAGLVLIEQLFRNTLSESRWATKFLFVGIGLIFVYDFFLYSDALLFNHINREVWAGRGYVVALTVPFLALSAQRNPVWSLEVFVSKQLVFHTATLISIGIYLLLMASAGYYIRIYGGNWGAVAQIVFLFLAVALLFVAFFSGEVRSKLKVFINKHFFNYKYDYREEWINITHDLSKVNEETSLYITVIHSISNLVESTGGMLWMHDDKKSSYQMVASTLFESITEKEPLESNFSRYLYEKDWIVDLNERHDDPAIYDGLTLPGWLEEQNRAWLVIPLRHFDELYGFLILAESRALHEINWEDRDLLKTACKQATSYLAFQKASESLARSEKFSVFNRLSAFVVHDLKNLIAQLQLITRNAEKFKDNPEFVDDAFETVHHASEKMQRLLTQLKQGRFSARNATNINISGAMEEVIRSHQTYLPHPELHCAVNNVTISANPDRFLAVIGHIIKNAQEATDDNGYVKVSVYYDNNVIIKVTDNGCGMEEQFIRDKLFTPFITTKGNAGMGVGVYECKEFIEALGGYVTVSSTPGQGSEFTLSIPAITKQKLQEVPE